MTTRFRFLLPALALLSYPSATLAGQTTMSIGAGASIATVAFDLPDAGAAPTPNSRLGLAVSAAFTFPLSERVGLQAGAALVQKGYRRDFFGEEVAFDIDYLELMVLARPSLPLGETALGTASAHLLAGPVLGLKRGCSWTRAGVGAECRDSFGGDVAYMDWGVAGGIGGQVGRFSLDLRYTLGLSKHNDDDDAPKNRALTVQAGVSFRPLGYLL